MKCKDCKGSGVYAGLGHFGPPEPCQRCGGSKEEPSGEPGEVVVVLGSAPTITFGGGPNAGHWIKTAETPHHPDCLCGSGSCFDYDKLPPDRWLLHRVWKRGEG